LRINSIGKKRVWKWETPSPVVSNIFMERFEEIALDPADHKRTKWLRYVDDRITGVSDFIHRPVFNNYKKKNKHDISETGSVFVLR
jgi:hypothetical protein